MVRSQGEVIPVRVDGRVVLGADDEFCRTHCIVQDTRAEMAARRAWERSEGRYRRLVELARRRRGIEELHDFEFMTKTGQRIITTMATSPLCDDDASEALGEDEGDVRIVATAEELTAVDAGSRFTRGRLEPGCISC